MIWKLVGGKDVIWEIRLLKKLRLFGTSGVRGIAETEMTPKLAERLGLTFASLLGNEGTVGVGRDVRVPAKRLSEALISGLISGGVNVENFGIVPTPAVLWGIMVRRLNGATVVTGSHTPKNIIGFLFFMKDTAELSQEESYKFEKLLFHPNDDRNQSQVGRRFDVDISEIYRRSVLKQLNLEKILSGNFRVVLDPGNGAATSVCSEIMKAAGVDVVVINEQPNGLFPGRDPYPRPEVLGELAKEVRRNRANLGSASDADGDRAIFVDHEGSTLWGDVSGCVFVKDVLLKKHCGTVVAPINSSQLVDWVCRRNNGRLVYTPIGPSAIVSAMKREGALIGIEETGKNIWSDKILYGDWVLSTLKMLEIMAQEQRSLCEIVKEFPKFHIRKSMYSCPEKLKSAVLNQAVKEWENIGEEAEVVTMDGVRINYPDGSWLLFRPSGTEAVFRVYVESRDLSRVKELENIGSKIVKRAFKQANEKTHRDKEWNM